MGVHWLKNKNYFPVFIVAMITVSLSGDIFFYTQSIDDIEQREAEKIRSIAVLSSNLIDYSLVKNVIEKGDNNSLEYKNLKKELEKIMECNSDIDDAYIMIKSDKTNIWLFVAGGYSTQDLDENGILTEDELEVELFEEYDISPYENMKKAFDAPIVDEEMYCDKWGCFISAYAPIKDDSGEAFAIIGIDIMNDKLLQKKDALLHETILMVSATIILSSFLGLFFWKNQKNIFEKNKELKKANEEILESKKKIEESNISLKNKVEELDKFKKLTVNRELKMMELKEKIKKLEEQHLEGKNIG